MKPVEVKKDIYWVGVVDWNIRDFHGYSTKKGTTYNSYLAVDEKVALFDTVKHGFKDELLSRIREIIDPVKIDYLVINHMEMDHSGCLPEIVEIIKPTKIYVSKMGAKSLKAHYNVDGWPLEVVGSGDTLSLGKRTVHFVETRMLHWPDNMFSYIPEEKLLISSDAFGHHWATSERFDDEVDSDELMQHCAKYYANILMLYAPYLQKLLASVAEMNLEIDTIAPDHGVIWRSDPGKILAAYQRWGDQSYSNKALVVYDTMWHSTEAMAKAVAEGIIDEGVSVKLMNLAVNHRSDAVYELLESRALVLGSATLNNGILPRMGDFLTYIKGLKPGNKIGAAFGSFGWSGEAVKIMNQALEDMKIEIVDEGIKTQFVPDDAALDACLALGRKIGKAVRESS